MGKLFTSKQKEQLDTETIATEGITSFYLMERAALKIASVLVNKSDLRKKKFLIICGIGNNGGDGLAIAKILLSINVNVRVVFCRFLKRSSSNCAKILITFKKEFPQNLQIINSADEFQIFENELIIDAIFGIGLNRQVEGEFAKVIQKINAVSNYKIAIDIPSGLFGEDNTKNFGEIVKANKTLYIEFPALSLLLPENYQYCGDLEKITIKIAKSAIQNTNSKYFAIDDELISEIKKQREPYSHKGNFGNALLFAGSNGYAGAAVLSAKACLKTGVGLLTVNSTEENRVIIQTEVPEAIFCSNLLKKVYHYQEDNYFLLDLGKQYSALGIGPGIGTPENFYGLKTQITETEEADIPMVLDADILNIIAKDLKQHKEFLSSGGKIITPHPKEFERIFGNFDNTWKKLQFMKKYSIKQKIVIVLKGGITYISTTDGKIYFNIGLNSGMATAGSGDVLTGVITSLLAQGYKPNEAAILGVYMHSKAGEHARQQFGESAMTASDIINNLKI